MKQKQKQKQKQYCVHLTFFPRFGYEGSPDAIRTLAIYDALDVDHALRLARLMKRDGYTLHVISLTELPDK